MNEDLIRHEDIKENCRIQGNKQHSEDADAVNRLRSSLYMLKKYIQNLIKKYPFIEDIVRKKRKDGIDPYDGNDMRSCYCNLLDRYRQSDEMGVLTTIMSGMAEKQGQKSTASFLLCVEDWHQTMIRLGVQHISISDLAAIITLKGMNEQHRIEFLQQENAIALTLETLENDENELNSVEKEDDLNSMAHSICKKSLLSRVKKFIQQDEKKRLINQRLSGGSGISGNNGSNDKSSKETEAMVREAQNVFMATLVDHGLCKYYQQGHCRHGDKCNFKHEETFLSKSNVKKSKDKNDNGTKSNQVTKKECFKWRDTGACPNGDKCKYLHSTSTTTMKSSNDRANNVADVKNEMNQSSSDSSLNPNKALFNIDDNGPSWGNDEESVKCIITEPIEDLQPDTVMHVESQFKRSAPLKLGWDTMASIHVAGDKHVIDKLRPMMSKRTASGMGGILPITHYGYSSSFNLDMHVIEGGQTPNIKSVGQALQMDGDGTEYAAIFTAKGATQLKMDARTKLQLMQVIEEATETKRIVGTAVQKNGVYEQTFEGSLDLKNDSMNQSESAYAVSSMYTKRAPLSSADDIIGMLVSACVKEEHLITGIKNKTIKGLPDCVTEEAVRTYFKINGKDDEMIKAEIANAPLKLPIDYERDTFNIPGEHLQIDNVDPSFAREKGKRDAVRSIGGYRDAIVAVDNSGYSIVVGRETKKNPHLIVEQFIKQWISKWQSLRKISADKEFVTVESLAICKSRNIKLNQAVPGDHRRGLGTSEGLNRWLQDAAQVHMNRLTCYVKSGEMTEHDKRSLWFQALTYANDIKLMAPSICDQTKTQFEEGEGHSFNLSRYAVLPFGIKVVARKKIGDQDGRGQIGIYVGFSKSSWEVS